MLWAIITKIQSESKSQPSQPLNRCNGVVSNHYEDTIWKQITTSDWIELDFRSLWAIITKIQSESKSQPSVLNACSAACCEQSLRRYNLKANHNSDLCDKLRKRVVSNHYEDTIWKQITTASRSLATRNKLWAIITKIQSESKSQHLFHLINSSVSCEQSLRRYNLKANHNELGNKRNKVKVVSNHYEDTIWKQITTVTLQVKILTCCEQSLRRYNLKANHNEQRRLL